MPSRHDLSPPIESWLWDSRAEKELRKLSTHAQAALLETVDSVIRGTALPSEDVKVDEKLREVRTSFGGDAFRVLYGKRRRRDSAVCRAVLVYQKKTQKLPTRHKKTARRRLRDWEEGLRG